jgi:hypothetical protein
MLCFIAPRTSKIQSLSSLIDGWGTNGTQVTAGMSSSHFRLGRGTALDRSKYLQFSHHPHTVELTCCSLALLEMYCILARIIFSFDIELADKTKVWVKDQDVFFFWQKPPLNMFLKPRVL